jgi:mannose-6-phosphate isomerase
MAIMNKLTMMLLAPNLQVKVWGGQKLKAFKELNHFDESEGGLGETWEVSCHPSGPSTYLGKDIRKDIDEEKLPYLVKFIDTAAELSIQVHPDDDYAKEHEDSKGKTESWLILASDEGSGIYLGLKPGVNKANLEIALSNKEDLSLLLNFYPVKVGDFFYVPAGTIHAIGKGVTLAEIQQSSGVTYRVWDWDRLGIDGKHRELHVKKSLDVISFDPKCNKLEAFYYQNERSNNESCLKLVEHSDFVVDRYYNQECLISLKGDHYHSLLVLEGSVSVEIENVSQVVECYQAVLIVSGVEMLVRATKGKARYLHIY